MARGLFDGELRRNKDLYEADMPVQLVLRNALGQAIPEQTRIRARGNETLCHRIVQQSEQSPTQHLGSLPQCGRSWPAPSRR